MTGVSTGDPPAGAGSRRLSEQDGSAMATTMEQRRAWRGAAALSQGFRPFFPLAALLAALAMALWSAWIEFGAAIPSGLDPVAWHVHELVYGYVPAVLAGFLLTAVPNWTGRLPVVGWPLAGLVGLWLLGRAAVMVSGELPAAVVGALVIAFPLALIFYLGREILQANNRRNLVVLGLLLVYAAGLALAHVELWRDGVLGVGHRISIATIILMIALIGGRITPSFTTNWLKKQGRSPLPAPVGLLDRLALIGSLPALILWSLGQEDGAIFAILSGVAAALHVLRLARWRGVAVLSEPLLFILHGAYAFIPLGFGLLAASAFGAALSPSAGLHAWTVGGVGGMTLAVMMRATLGHTGRALSATPAAKAAPLALLAAAVARIGAESGVFGPGALGLAAGAWTLAMLIFVAAFGRLALTRP